MTKTDNWLTPDEATARLSSAGYSSKVNGNRLEYWNKDVDKGIRGSLTIHDAEYGQGVDEQALARIEGRRNLNSLTTL